MDASIIVPTVVSALVAGLYGAIKYYSNTLGPNAEQFDMNKFIPIVVISILISIGFAVGANQMFTADQIVEYLGANFTLVIFANTVYTIILKKFNISSVV